jgi:hypothetical protein
MSHRDVARAAVETDRGVPREQRVELELGQLVDARR